MQILEEQGLTLVIFLLGVILILIGARRRKAAGARELGTAFVIAAIVTVTYELHSRKRYDLANFEKVLESLMGEVVARDAWIEVRKGVIERTVIRRDLNIRVVSLQHNEALAPGQAELCLEVEYSLEGLHASARTLSFRPELDQHMANTRAGLPRFDWVTVGAKQYDAQELGRLTQDGRLSLEIAVPPRDSPGIRVASKRHEVVPIPGSYFLLMSELTLGVTVAVDQLPNDKTVEVRISADRPEKESFRRTVKTGTSWHYPGIVLPGQGIELQMSQSSRPTAPQGRGS